MKRLLSLLVLFAPFVLFVLIFCAPGCTDSFRPHVEPIASSPSSPNSYAHFAQQFDQNRTLPPDAQRHLVILIETPAYGLYDQIRAGNMGHAAIEIDHHLHDIGSLNGYARAFAATRAVHFWNFPTAADALAHLINHPDTDGALPRLTRFDLTITPAQETFLTAWWQQMDSVTARPDNHLYFWNSWQCASAVAASLHQAGIIFLTPSTPEDLRSYLAENLRHTCGPNAGQKASLTILQPGTPGRTASPLTGFLQLLLHAPQTLAAGQRTPLMAADPTGESKPLLWTDSPAYLQQIKTFHLSPTAAATLLHKKNPQLPPDTLPNFTLGRWYHFPTDHIIGQAALAGLYLQADTGQITELQSPNIIRFDLFQGDTIIAGDSISQ